MHGFTFLVVIFAALALTVSGMSPEAQVIQPRQATRAQIKRRIGHVKRATVSPTPCSYGKVSSSYKCPATDASGGSLAGSCVSSGTLKCAYSSYSGLKECAYDSTGAPETKTSNCRKATLTPLSGNSCQIECY